MELPTSPNVALRPVFDTFALGDQTHTQIYLLAYTSVLSFRWALCEFYVNSG